jgi:hypothetical protein
MTEDRHPLLPHLMTLLESARRDIVISCPEAIMPLFDNDDAISEMLRVARRARQTGLRVLLQQFEPVKMQGSRFINSMQRIPTKAECRLLEEHPEWRSETLVIIDQAAGLLIPTKTRRRIDLSERREVKARLNRFNALWDAAHPAHEMRRLR